MPNVLLSLLLIWLFFTEQATKTHVFMKTNKRLMLSFAFVALTGSFLMSCSKTEKNSETTLDENEKSEVILKDYGKDPLVINIEDYTISNENFRTALWTGTSFQMTLMSIPVGGNIGLELHGETDQFLRIEAGKGKVYMGDSKENLDFVREVSDDFVVLVPAGKWHNIENTGDKPLKIYSIYSPVEHPHGTIHKTQEDDLGHH